MGNKRTGQAQSTDSAATGKDLTISIPNRGIAVGTYVVMKYTQKGVVLHSLGDRETAKHSLEDPHLERKKEKAYNKRLVSKANFIGIIFTWISKAVKGEL